MSAFAANAAEAEGAVEDGQGEGRENESNQLPSEGAQKAEAETSRKRKAKEAATPKKPASKAPRRSADKAKKIPSKAESVATEKKATKLDSFFKRADNAGD